MKKVNWKQLISSIVIVELVGVLSSLLSGNISSVYKSLIKPPLSPPGWLFGVVWPILYALIAIALYIICQKASKEHAVRLRRLFYLQLFVNFLWPIVFFRFLFFRTAGVLIILLDILVYFTMKAFSSVDKKAGRLIIPYFLWLLFATYLNFGIIFLN